MRSPREAPGLPVPNAPGPLPPPPSPNQGRWRAGRDELAEAMSARAFPSASYTPLGTSGPWSNISAVDQKSLSPVAPQGPGLSPAEGGVGAPRVHVWTVPRQARKGSPLCLGSQLSTKFLALGISYLCGVFVQKVKTESVPSSNTYVAWNSRNSVHVGTLGAVTIFLPWLPHCPGPHQTRLHSFFPAEEQVYTG